ncbi:E motif [Dillenia turbinata]|uniref:E motif n=1 Tax=Dillenia turbinata TaxID=194707 RepID=A0AAN8V9B1_9MAGN
METLNSMNKERGIVPRMEHYACVVDVFCRSGNLEEAVEFISSMPITADALVWHTLLGACLVHGNKEIAKHAAKMIIKQDPDDPAAYILLSNLYSSSGQWEDVAEIRKIMKQREYGKRARLQLG